MLLLSLFLINLQLSFSAQRYVLDNVYTAKNFQSSFQFEAIKDPTEGFVSYVDEAKAIENGLFNVSSGQIYLGVDYLHHWVLPPRSVRLASKRFFDGNNIIVFDLEHMPTTKTSGGCGLWPAIWLNGQQPPIWPKNGEIDIIEYVNNDKSTACTLHTAPGCKMPESPIYKYTYQNCNEGNAANGCGIKTTAPVGGNFNELNGQKGGVYVLDWDKVKGIRIFFFRRNEIPIDLWEDPNPDSWNAPIAYFPFGDDCAFDYFRYQHITINIDICGQWAGNTFGGQCGSYSNGNCHQYVMDNRHEFSEAYFLINNITIWEKVQNVEFGTPQDDVKFSISKQNLTFVPDIQHIETGPIYSYGTVDAYQLSNQAGITVKMIQEGGNIIQISKNGQDYIWNNKEGACYYGSNSDAFPLNRGLILHGGIRMGAVSAEHGLFYDTLWNITYGGNSKSKYIKATIIDSEHQRSRIFGDTGGKFSGGQYNRGDIPNPELFSKYPVTNLKFSLIVTLNANEPFVRIRAEVENPTPTLAIGEVWIPMTFPVDEDSMIISEQKLRWRRDEWCMGDLANIIEYDRQPSLQKPLNWSSSCIFYDFPSMDGTFHGVNSPGQGGKGIFFITEPNSQHFTKMWSWGSKSSFNREAELQKQPPLGAGRPATEYYEPWSSGFNSAFFEKVEFLPGTVSFWEIAILPIEGGLTSTNMTELRSFVKSKVGSIPTQLAPSTHNFPLSQQFFLESVVGTSDEGKYSYTVGTAVLAAASGFIFWRRRVPI